jgi:hypothetical protein
MNPFMIAILVWGQVQCDPTSPELCSTPLREGEVAPFSGTLLTPDLVLRLGQKVEEGEARHKIEMDRAQSLAEVELTRERSLRAVDAAAATSSVAAWRDRASRLEEQLRASEDRSWFDTPAAGFTVGVVVTLLLVGVIGLTLSGLARTTP